MAAQPPVERTTGGAEAALVLVAAAVLTIGLLLLGDGRDTQRFLFAATTLPWVTVLIIQSAVWGLLGWPSWKAASKLWNAAAPAQKRVVLSTSLLFLLAVLPSIAPFVFGGFPSPIPGHKLKMGLLTITGVLFAVPSIAGMFLVDAVATRKFRAPTGTPEEVRELLAFRQQLLRFRSILGAFVALAMLAAGAQRNALSALPTAEPAPMELVWLYGGYFSLLFVLIFVPTYMRLQGLAHHIADAICGWPESSKALSSADVLATYATTRRAVNDILHVETKILDVIGSGLVIFTPLLAALASSLVGLKL